MNNITVMKNIYKICIVAFLFLATSFTVNAAISYSLDNRCGSAQLVVLVTPNINYSGGLAVWTPAVFTIRWPMTLGSGVLGAITNQNGFAFATAGALGNDGTYYYQKFAHSAGTTLAMTSGVSYEVTRIALVGGGTGVYGTFEIPASDNPWIQPPQNGMSVFSNSNGNQVVSPYGAYSSGSIPMFAGIFWDGISWCGGSGVNEQPGAADGTLTCYINGMGAQLTTPVATPAVVNKLKIGTGSRLTIVPGAAMTVTDSSFIGSPQGLVIASDATGSGSFKNCVNTWSASPVIKTSYPNSGSATVQVWMQNTPTAGVFQMHLIGPPVYNPAITDPTGATGAGPAYQYLQAFELQDAQTYSYRYNEPTNAWVNIFTPTDQIPRLGGIAVSDNTGVSKVLSFTGKLNTGNVNNPTAPSGFVKSVTPAAGAGLYVFSNPYPCGLLLEQFQSDNAARLLGNFWTWENQADDNYGLWYFDEVNGYWDGTLGIFDAGGVVSPGQGFFGQYSIATGTLTARSTVASDLERVHVHTPILKSGPVNVLRVTAEGNSSRDQVLVKFSANSTPGYDERRDFEKWSSMYDYATEINTYAGDLPLTVNSLPNLLPGQMTNVPMDFKCGADGTYTITASQIETFESGTEIWLEDLKTGAEWYSLNDNPVYTFDGSPADDHARFIIHFFGPTGIDDPQAEVSAVKIYSYGQDAYIVNKGKETIKEYIAYDMMGRELHSGTLPNNTVNKVQIGDVSAYYVVKVITKEGHVYTGKVFISK
jgi:hypothetical protein